MPRIALKPLSQQVVVLTGGTSGIGLVTARLLAQRGARLFLIARNESALRAVQDEIRGKGGQAHYAVADVADKAAVDAAAAEAIATYGSFDTWVNDAGAFIYGRLDTVALEDQRRLFDVTYWGTVHGALAAARHLKQTGGAIVNVGSVLGDIAIPYQGGLLCGQIRAQRLHRSVAARGRGRTAADLVHADQAGCDQHTLYRPCPQPDGIGGDAQSATGL